MPEPVWPMAAAIFLDTSQYIKHDFPPGFSENIHGL